MIQGLTQKQCGDLIYLGTFFYEALLREDNLINDKTNTIGGVVSYAAWEIYMLAGITKLNVDPVATKSIKSPTWDLLVLSKVIDLSNLDHDNLNVIRRYLPNAYIRSKATLLGTLALSRGISEFDAWRGTVIDGLNGDEPAKVGPYLREVFETSQGLIREKRTQPPQPARSDLLKTFFTMNRNQRIALIAGAVFFVVMLLVPPWHYVGGRSNGYHFLFWPPARSIFIDSTRLVVQCLLVAAVTVGAFVLLKSKSN